MRLEALYQLIPDNSIVVDVGTDHGLLLVRSVESGKVSHAYGLDINPLPLSQAQENVERYGLADKIDLMLGNGLREFENFATCFVLAGMGAELIWDILSHYEFKESQTIIIQSNTKHAWLRTTLSSNDFVFVDEVYLRDKGIDVFIMVVRKGKSQKMSFNDSVLGPVLMQDISGAYRDYLIEFHQHLEKIKHNRDTLEATYRVLDDVVGKGSSNE